MIIDTGLLCLIHKHCNLVIVSEGHVQNYILQGEVKPLWGASNEGKLGAVEVLLNQGAEVNLSNDVRTYNNHR